MTYISKKKIKKSKRGLTFSFNGKGTKFDIGNHYIIDVRGKQIVILPTEDKQTNIVSKKNVGRSQKALFDIRNKQIVETFSHCDYLEVIIYKEKIRVVGHKDNVIRLKLKTNDQVEMVFDKQSVLKAVGDTTSVCHNFEANGFNISSREKRKVSKVLEDVQIPLRVISLFSGAGLFDFAFKEVEGFDIVFALEKDKDACKTYASNIGPIVNADIRTYQKEQVPRTDIVLGSLPCTPYTLERHNYSKVNPNQHSDYDLIDAYIQWVKDQDAIIFVMENVPGFLEVNHGYNLKLIKHQLSDYELDYGILNDIHMGGYQIRKRAIVIGSKIGRIKLPKPIIHTKSLFKTVRDAIGSINSNMPNQKDYTRSTDKVIERMKYIPAGGNIKDVPKHLRTKAQHSNAYKRLDYDKPCITLTNYRKPIITHPEFNRILSVREAAALSGLPHTYEFFGSLDSMQTQVGNGVPIALGRSIAKAIKNYVLQYNNKLKLLYP